MFDKEKYFETMAREDILAYLNERKEKATLNWVYGCLKELVEHKKATAQKIEDIILDIENNPERYLLDKFPQRREKLENLKETIHDSGL